MRCHTCGLQRQSPARAGHRPAPACLRQADSCETNPISAGHVGRPGRLRQTNPIPAEGKKWQVPGREEVMVNGTSDQPRQDKANFQAWSFVRNKANLGRWLAPRARGTNKANWREWPIVRNKPNSVREQETASARRAKSYGVLAIQTAPTKRTQFPAMPGGAPGMWDAGQMCKTNPISDEVKRDEAPGAWDAGATVRNKANSRQTKGRVQWQHEYERRRL
jgi:hypothetical protein